MFLWYFLLFGSLPFTHHALCGPLRRAPSLFDLVLVVHKVVEHTTNSTMGTTWAFGSQSHCLVTPKGGLRPWPAPDDPPTSTRKNFLGGEKSFLKGAPKREVDFRYTTVFFGL